MWLIAVHFYFQTLDVKHLLWHINIFGDNRIHTNSSHNLFLFFQLIEKHLIILLRVKNKRNTLKSTIFTKVIHTDYREIAKNIFTPATWTSTNFHNASFIPNNLWYRIWILTFSEIFGNKPFPSRVFANYSLKINNVLLNNFLHMICHFFLILNG